MAENTPGSLVPLGQANTGSAFVLDQNNGLQPLRMLQGENRYKDLMAAREAKRRADEEDRNFKEQQKLLEKPEEFGLHYQAIGSQKVQEYLNGYMNRIKANGGKPLNIQQQAEVRAEQLRLNDWARATKTAEVAATTLRTNIAQNKYYNKEQVEQDARGLFFDPDGKIKDDPTSIDWDKGFEQITSQPKNINIGAVSNDFVESLAGKYVEKFSTNGVFDIKTIEEYKLPVQVNPDGTVDYDNSGRPILKVTPGLMNEINKMPEFKTYLDGREKEENAKADADPAYKPKERYALAREVLESEVYAKTIRNRNRIPVRADRDDGTKKKEQSALDRLNLIDDAVLNNDPVALQSFNASSWQGGKIVGVRDVVDPGSKFNGGQLNSLQDLYSSDPRRIKVLTINRGTKKVGDKEVDDIIEIKIDPSEPGWQAKVNQGINTANANVEPELFKKAVEVKYGKSNSGTGKVNPAASTVKNAPSPSFNPTAPKQTTGKKFPKFQPR